LPWLESDKEEVLPPEDDIEDAEDDNDEEEEADEEDVDDINGYHILQTEATSSMVMDNMVCPLSSCMLPSWVVALLWGVLVGGIGIGINGVVGNVVWGALMADGRLQMFF
jgi:hypothetical protein